MLYLYTSHSRGLLNLHKHNNTMIHSSDTLLDNIETAIC